MRPARAVIRRCKPLCSQILYAAMARSKHPVLWVPVSVAPNGSQFMRGAAAKPWFMAAKIPWGGPSGGAGSVLVLRLHSGSGHPEWQAGSRQRDALPLARPMNSTLQPGDVWRRSRESEQPRNNRKESQRGNNYQQGGLATHLASAALFVQHAGLRRRPAPA